MAKFTTLYSGSAGNCSYIEENGKYLLIDMGKSCKITTEKLKELKSDISDLSAILITHEHSDHIKGLHTFLKKNQVPVYGHQATLRHLLNSTAIPQTAQVTDIENRTVTIDGFEITSFENSHDSIACLGYRIQTPQGKIFTIATDLGYVSEKTMDHLKQSHVINIECNYDDNMLKMGQYPYYLKTRIASNTGHLRNEDCAKAVMELVQDGCTKFSLCHLSAENNTKTLALSAVQKELKNQDIVIGKDVFVQVADRHEIAPIIEF